MEHYSAVKKEEKFTFCNSMDGPGEHYAKWNKPVGERQILYDFIHYVESNEQNQLCLLYTSDAADEVDVV